MVSASAAAFFSAFWGRGDADRFAVSDLTGFDQINRLLTFDVTFAQLAFGGDLLVFNGAVGFDLGQVDLAISHNLRFFVVTLFSGLLAGNQRHLLGAAVAAFFDFVGQAGQTGGVKGVVGVKELALGLVEAGERGGCDQTIFQQEVMVAISSTRLSMGTASLWSWGMILASGRAVKRTSGRLRKKAGIQAHEPGIIQPSVSDWAVVWTP